MDYVYPQHLSPYFLFFLFLVGGIFFFVRSLRDGYWGEHSEDLKYRMLDDEEEQCTKSQLRRDRNGSRRNERFPEDLKSYAGGWMTEKKGTDSDVPEILTSYCLRLPRISLAFINGEVNHSTRGRAGPPVGCRHRNRQRIYVFCAALIAIFAIITVKFAFRVSRRLKPMRIRPTFEAIEGRLLDQDGEVPARLPRANQCLRLRDPIAEGRYEDAYRLLAPPIRSRPSADVSAAHLAKPTVVEAMR